MKIVHLCLCGPVTDGWNYQENILSKFHVKNGNEVSIITSKWVWNENGKIVEYNKFNYINSDGVKMIRLNLKSGDVTNKFKYYLNLFETLESEKPDIIFMHGVQCRNVSDVVKYVKSHKVKLFVDNHADFSNSATNFISKNILHGIIWRYYAKKLIPYVEKFYGVLPSRVDFLENVYKIPKEKCELLVMGADDEYVEKSKNKEIIQILRAKYNIKDTDFLIVTGGKIDLFKKQTLLLMKAVKNIKNSSVKLIVFGSVVDDLKQEIEELNDGNKVQYIGWIKASDSYQYFAIADLVVFPGRHSVFWEQVAGQGIPMVVKDWPGTHHIDLGGNVKYLVNDSVEEIEKVLNSIISNKKVYEEMKNTAVKKGMIYFSYKDIAKRCIE